MTKTRWHNNNDDCQVRYHYNDDIVIEDKTVKVTKYNWQWQVIGGMHWQLDRTTIVLPI